MSLFFVFFVGVAWAQQSCQMNQPPQLSGKCILPQDCQAQDNIYTFADSTPLCSNNDVCCHAKVPCDFGGGVKGICRLETNCRADWPNEPMPVVAGKCVGPDTVRCCRAKCIFAYGPWSGACAACAGAFETRSVDVKDTQGFSLDVCLEQAVARRPCMLPCPGSTTTATTTTKTTTTTTSATVTAAPPATLPPTLPPIGTAVVVPTTGATTAPGATTATIGATSAASGSTAAPAGQIGGVEGWIVGVAAGGGVLVAVCVILAVVCLVRKKRSGYHSDRDENANDGKAVGLRASATYASPAVFNAGDYNAAPPIPLYDSVPPNDEQIAVAQATAAYTSEGLIREQQTQIVYDATMPMTAGAGNVAGNRFSVAPKF